MEEGRIEMVLARITELRSKITNCIAADRTEGRELRKGGAEMDSGDEVSDCLLSIRDALEKLEVLVSSLQALHQQQLYEKAEAFAGIAYSQEKLLKKLKEYKGDNLDIINEAIAFVGETVEESNDLLLPPYPTQPYPLVSDKLYPSYPPSSHMLSQNGAINGSQPHQLTKDLHQEEAKSPSRMVTCFIGVAARTALTVVGLISVLTLAGFEPRLKKRDNCLKATNPFQLFGIDKKGRNATCPPGKVLVFENGETRCVVRERVEVPFHSDVATPDVNHGCG
ncbi:PREDICTED: plastid division protein PDV2-like [Ipomoea nil]|uniref:plastid division protein PDV2-like n=1 Tax=Ipomoea nil TaxID=35883 RepID=UPI0009015A5E|nr:PREDICTED: plastid division protein PDV2-like [Ipomoea nil]